MFHKIEMYAKFKFLSFLDLINNFISYFGILSKKT